MPHSALSAGSSGSTTSSRRGRTKNYKTVGRNSSVDETLFGPPLKDKLKELSVEERRNSAPENMKQRSQLSKNKKDAPEVVQVITKDLIRKLIVPRDDPSGRSIVLSGGDFKRIWKCCQVSSKQQRESMQEELKQQKGILQDDCNQRKTFMAKMEMTRKTNEKLSDLEEEAKQRAQYLLEKAMEQKQEQEDEIKHLNELILNAKCHAIRDAQILEKGVIGKEYQQEEKRLDTMMEADRLKDIQIQEEIEHMRKAERYEGAKVILQQISEREEELMLEMEKKDQEATQMRKYLGKLQEEDIKDLEKKRAMQRETQQAIDQANTEAEQMREVKKEQERVADEKVLEYMRQKAERDSAFEAEQEKKRLEKEKEVARLRALQERAKDVQAEKDALRAKRNQEAAEREWRMKEHGEALKKQEMEDMLRNAREEQVQFKEHYQAVQAARDRAEFQRVVQAQTELIEKEKKEEAEHCRAKLKHASDVRKQIRDHEQEQIAARNAFFEEGLKMEEEAKVRRQRLEEIKKKKLAELKEAGVPDKYCSEVNRRVLNAPPVGIR